MARVPSYPMHFDHKTILAGIEPAYGDDTGVIYAPVRIWDVQASWMEVEEKELPYVLPYMGARSQAFLKKRMTLAGKVALVSAGTPGAIPPMDSLLRACGMVRTQIELTPAATIAAVPVAVGSVDGAWSYARDTAYGGSFDRVVTITCTTGGASGVAEVTIAAPAVEYLEAHEQTGVVLTDGADLLLPGGAVITPTVTTPLNVGDSWTIQLTAAGCSYHPSSDRQGHKSLSIRVMMPDGSAGAGNERLYSLVGARGEIKAAGTVNDYPYFEIAFTSLFTVPATAPGVAADFDAWADPIEVSTGNTPICRLFGHDVVAEAFSFDAGNAVSLVERVGRREVRINDRKSKGSLKIEEPGLGEFNIITVAASRAVGELVFQHGFAPGEIVRFAGDRVQLGKPAHAESEKDLVVDVPLTFLPTAGDDEWSITFS